MEAGESDVIIVGGGVNSLVCAVILARSGLSVQLVDEPTGVAGMHRTEFPFAKASRLATATGAHRVGFVPPELLSALGIALPLVPRDPSLFVPTTQPGRYILAGAGNEGLRQATGGVVSPRDAGALEAMHAELDAMVADLGPAWSTATFEIEEVAERFVRPELRAAFVALVRGTFAEYVARFDVQNGLLKAALAASSLAGSFASWDSPGSGASLLIHHAATSRAGGGDAAPAGGMGAVVRALVDAAQAAGARIESGKVTQIVVEGNTTAGVLLADGSRRKSGSVVTSADPWRMRALVGADRFPVEYTRRIDGWSRPGGLAKLHVAFSELPRFACLPSDQGQHRATTLLLSGGEDDAVRALGRAFASANAGRLDAEAPIECVFTSLGGGEPLRDPDGRHSASLLVPWVPYDLAGTTWSAEEERYTSMLLDVLESFAPGARSLVVDTALYHPKKIESHFGVTRGQLGHVDDTLLFGDRMAPATPIGGLYVCGRGCAPAGGVFGIAGLSAARRVITDIELALERTEVGIL